MALKQRQWAAVGALAVAGAALAYISMGGIEKNLVYYLAPDELLAKGAQARAATVRLGGLVQKGSLNWNHETLELKFRVGLAPEGDPAVLVHASGAPPQMFQEGIGAVVEGQYDGQVFHADRVMVKHSNEYRPPAPGEKPKSLYGTLSPGDESGAGSAQP
jgi:cytochrome c-type biogenesis protein CcmE